MEQVYGVRHLVLAEGWGVRRTARKFGISRNTVRRYLKGADPGVRKPGTRPWPVLERVRGRLDEILEESKAWTQGNSA